MGETPGVLSLLFGIISCQGATLVLPGVGSKSPTRPRELSVDLTATLDHPDRHELEVRTQETHVGPGGRGGWLQDPPPASGDGRKNWRVSCETFDKIAYRWCIVVSNFSLERSG